MNPKKELLWGLWVSLLIDFFLGPQALKPEVLYPARFSKNPDVQIYARLLYSI